MVKRCYGFFESGVFGAEDYSVAINLNATYGLAYYNRSIAFQNAGKMNEACKDLQKSEKSGIRIDAKIKQKICS